MGLMTVTGAGGTNNFFGGGSFATKSPGDICYVYYCTFSYENGNYSCEAMTQTHEYFRNGIEANGVKIAYYSMNWHVITTKKVMINGTEYAAGVEVASWGYSVHSPSAYVWVQLED